MITTRFNYDAIDAVNWSTLKFATVSAARYKHALTHATPETDAMRFGRWVHALVFEPDVAEREFAVWEGDRRAGKAWGEFAAANATRTIIRPHEVDLGRAIQQAIMAHPVAAALLHEGEPEQTIMWTDRPTGIKCKARLDWVGLQSFVDLKTTRDIDARAFAAHCSSLQYHGQMAFYADGLKANGMERTCKIIAVEMDEPHEVAVFAVGEDMLWWGEILYREALRMVKRARESRTWPGRYPDEIELALPGYAYPGEAAEGDALAEVEL